MQATEPIVQHRTLVSSCVLLDLLLKYHVPSRLFLPVLFVQPLVPNAAHGSRGSSVQVPK